MEQQQTPSGRDRPAVLVLTHRVPYPPDRGDRLRAWRFIRLLAEVAEVDVACFSDERSLDRERLAPLYEKCRQVRIVQLGAARWLRAAWSLATGRSITEGAFSSPRLARAVRHWCSAKPYDAILAYCSSMFQYVPPATSAERIVVDLVDADSRKWDQLAQVSPFLRRWLYQCEAKRLERLERHIAERFPVTVVSNREAAVLRQWVPNACIQVVRNGVDLEYFRPAKPCVDQTPLDQPLRCVFVGVLDYEPNVDAVIWFVGNVWRAIRTRYPDARLSLVGKRPTAAIRNLAGRDGIELYADVPDVRPFVWQAHVSIAPLRIARGVQNKVLEAMAMGRSVVASPVALEGIDPPEAPPAVEAQSPSEWIAAVARLLDDPSYRRRLETEGRAFVERYYDHRRCMQPMVSLLLGDRCAEPTGKSASPRVYT
ncbi:MAG: glycosyl transferase [Pirellulaceae bacterium]|nr:MAG: glycosyl transferase [Pirellulaceae bacterium]